MNESVAVATTERPQVRIRRARVCELLDELGLRTMRARAAHLKISAPVAWRLLHDRDAGAPEHPVSVDTIAAIRHAFPDVPVDDLFDGLGGQR